MDLHQHLDAVAADLAQRQATNLGRPIRDGRDDDLQPPPSGTSPALPTALHIAYRSSSGDISHRVITLLCAWRADDLTYFQGRCHLRRAIRTFRADRVVELVCLASGEAPDSAENWVRQHALYEGERVEDYTPHALRGCRDELALLAYVGQADGVFDADEVEIAIDYVMMSTDEDIDRDRAEHYIRRLTPSIADISEHLQGLAAHPERWARLARAMRRLVDADRVVTADEQIAWTEIRHRQETETIIEAQAKSAAEVAELLSAGPMAVAIDLSRLKFEALIADAVTGAKTAPDTP